MKKKDDVHRRALAGQFVRELFFERGERRQPLGIDGRRGVEIRSPLEAQPNQRRQRAREIVEAVARPRMATLGYPFSVPPN